MFLVNNISAAVDFVFLALDGNNALEFVKPKIILLTFILSQLNVLQ